MFRIFSLAFLMLALFCCVAPAADLSALLEDFYGGLADIIENNMDEPQNCVREVDAYYQDNQALVYQIQEETANVMAQAAPMMQGMMDDYQSAKSEEELRAMESPEAGDVL
jgi:hypothetical protein